MLCCCGGGGGRALERLRRHFWCVQDSAPLTADGTTAAIIAVTFAAGIVQLLMGALGMGLLLASLMSWPVMSAFLSGAAIITVVSQVSG